MEPLTRLSYYFPWSFVVALILALLFAIIGTIVYKEAIKRGEELKEEKLHPLLEKCKAFLARFGLFPSNPLNQSFEHALKMMHTFIGGKRFRYQLPWIVMLGGSSTGKSTILQSLDLDRPIGRPHFETAGGDKPLCDWWFYDHGIVLDLDGKIVIDSDKASSDESNWTLFLNLLVHYRPHRALDGIVLTIPASEIGEQTRFSHDDIVMRANYFYDKLWQIQRLTGFKIPIYIVVTECDLVPGFESFCKAIPEHTKSDIFGWSNDKAVDSIYNADWIDEAFSTLSQSLYRAQEEIYTESNTINNHDGVFLFPIALYKLKKGIKTYTNHLFKTSGYHDSFFLRGIYFVGDSHIEKIGFKPSSTLELPWHFKQKVDNENRNLYFATNLFEKKIFREVGLACPVSRSLLGNTTAIRFAKVAIAILTITGTFGLLRMNEKIQDEKTNLVPILSHIEMVLEKIHGQNETTDIERLHFDQQAQILLNAMTQLDVTHFSSFYFPPSWFSRLDEKMRDVMILAYDKVILRSMSTHLNYKARQLVSFNTDIPESPGSGVDPLKTVEFNRLRNYLVNLSALELAANKFNSLKTTSNLQYVADIIKYLFNYDMPPGFFKNDTYYISALKSTNVQLFNFEKYQNAATVKLNKLFDEFQTAIFDPKQTVPGLSALFAALNQFSGARTYAAFDMNVLREIFVNLQTTIKSITNPEFQWLNADQFIPGPQYEYVIQLMGESKFFTTPSIANLISKMNQGLIDFRKRLAGYSSPLFAGHSLFVIENGLAIAEPSEEAFTLADNLRSFFKEAFMAPSSNKAIITTIPVGSILLWDTLRLSDAVNLINSYNEFVNTRLLNMPKFLQPLLVRVAKESLAQNIVSSLANAEIFSSQIVTAGNSMAPEDALLSQVQNYRAAAPYLEQLLFTLKANNANAAFMTLKNLLTTQAYAPLEKLDAILREEAPYAIKMDSFKWWNGQNMAGLEALGVSNPTELKNYLELQRERINYLAHEFAEPLVSFLERINKGEMPGNLPLVAKWQGIIDGLNGYVRKASGNGLMELEDFIMNPLNEVTIGTCTKYLTTANAFPATNDFFVKILVNIQEKLRKQCNALVGSVAIDTYTQLSQFFNANLAGKFPFVQQAECPSSDADPEDIRTFFQMLDDQASNIVATLKQAGNLGPAGGKSALVFIEQMDKLRSFFGGFVAPNSLEPAPAFTFDVAFRVNKANESRGNEILDWRLITQEATLSRRSPSHKGSWTAGEPLKVVFRWAINSPLQPVRGDTPNFDVQGEDAVYSYDGTWALLRLLLQHQVTKLVDKEPTILQFEIPLTSLTNVNTACSQTAKSATPQKAVVFISLAISPVPAKTDAGSKSKLPAQKKISGGKPVPIPFFPFHAPELSSLSSHTPAIVCPGYKP